MTRCGDLVMKRKALGLLRRARSVGVFVECRTGVTLYAKATKKSLRAALRNLPNGSKVSCQDVFGQLVFGL